MQEIIMQVSSRALQFSSQAVKQTNNNSSKLFPGLSFLDLNHKSLLYVSLKQNSCFFKVVILRSRLSQDFLNKNTPASSCPFLIGNVFCASIVVISRIDIRWPPSELSPWLPKTPLTHTHGHTLFFPSPYSHWTASQTVQWAVFPLVPLV